MLDRTSLIPHEESKTKCQRATYRSGKPSHLRKTASGQSGKWEYVDYEIIKNYATVTDPATGKLYQRLVSVTKVEKGRTNVEFENDVVTAVEESEDKQGSNVKIVVPPLVFGW